MTCSDKTYTQNQSPFPQSISVILVISQSPTSSMLTSLMDSPYSTWCQISAYQVYVQKLCSNFPDILQNCILRVGFSLHSIFHKKKFIRMTNYDQIFRGIHLSHRNFVTGCTTGYTAFMKNGGGIICTGGATDGGKVEYLLKK